MRQRNRTEDVGRRIASKMRIDDAVERTVVLSADDSVMLHPHRFEQDVRNQLMSEPHLHFTSLVVRRIEDGVMLEGVLETDGAPDVGNLVRRISGVDRVLNRLVVRQTNMPPKKG